MNTMRMKALGLIAATLLMAATATACGGGSSGANDSSTNDASSSQSDGNDSASNSASDSANELADAIDKVGGGSGDCLKAAVAYATLSLQTFGAAFGGSESDIQDIEDNLGELQSEIPSELKDDFQVYSDALGQYAEQMKDVSFGDLFNPETQQKMEDASSLLDTDDVKTAQQNIEDYFTKTCPDAEDFGSGS